MSKGYLLGSDERTAALHGLVNNAGITHRARLLDVQLADLQRVVAASKTRVGCRPPATTPRAVA